ncbi:MAG: DUF882 domain-containing protein [Steroidobacteraceae bacterium]|jgi:uncharacterized protein YcbK (DUF882 family)|nr:DUF882 domain-containing protein [Steroidobacteraceae bacterium]
MSSRLSRRSFLGVSVGSGLALACGVSTARAGEEPFAALAGAAPAEGPAGGLVERVLRPGVSRVLELFNTHTSERLRVAYRTATGFAPESLDRLQWLLRDHRANESAPIDPLLFDQLAALAAAAGVEPRYQIISGYRSPLTNAKLAAAGRGVATRSLHMQGKAIDVRLHGVPCDALRDLALAAGQGGVGYYAKSDFVHLDTGRVRTWAG